MLTPPFTIPECPQTYEGEDLLGTALAACGATFAHLVKLTIHIVQGEELQKGFQVEIDAIAFLPE